MNAQPQLPDELIALRETGFARWATDAAPVKNPAASGGALRATQTGSTANLQPFRYDDVEYIGG